jgi:hypothetical protein
VIHNPADASVAQLVDLGQPQGASAKCLPIALFRAFFAQVTVAILGGTGVTAFSIYAATDAAGTGGVPVVTHALGSLPNALNDSVCLECNAEQVHETLPAATHVGVWLDCNHADDQAAVTFIRGEPLFARADLTPDYVS